MNGGFAIDGNQSQVTHFRGGLRPPVSDEPLVYCDILGAPKIVESSSIRIFEGTWALGKTEAIVMVSRHMFVHVLNMFMNNIK